MEYICTYIFFSISDLIDSGLTGKGQRPKEDNLHRFGDRQSASAFGAAPLRHTTPQNRYTVGQKNSIQ